MAKHRDPIMIVAASFSGNLAVVVHSRYSSHHDVRHHKTEQSLSEIQPTTTNTSPVRTR